MAVCQPLTAHHCSRLQPPPHHDWLACHGNSCYNISSIEGIGQRLICLPSNILCTALGVGRSATPDSNLEEKREESDLSPLPSSSVPPHLRELVVDSQCLSMAPGLLPSPHDTQHLRRSGDESLCRMRQP